MWARYVLLLPTSLPIDFKPILTRGIFYWYYDWFSIGTHCCIEFNRFPPNTRVAWVDVYTWMWLNSSGFFINYSRDLRNLWSTSLFEKKFQQQINGNKGNKPSRAHQFCMLFLVSTSMGQVCLVILGLYSHIRNHCQFQSHSNFIVRLILRQY